MTDSEQILAKIEGMELYFTDKRLIFISSSFVPKNVPSGGVVGEILNQINSRRQEKKIEEKEQELKSMTLYEKLQKIKGSYAIPYDNLDEFVLSKSRFGGQACIKAKSGWKYLNFNKEQLSQLATLFPSIPLLKGKYRIQ
jgi:hypothetical protein